MIEWERSLWAGLGILSYRVSLDAKGISSMKTVLTIIGALATLLGLIWMAQGTGIFPYPEQSFMINQTPWIWYGAGLAAVGAVVVWWSRRLG